MKKISTILAFVMLLLSLYSVSALGISSPYWQDGPLKMYAGETRDISFPLTNDGEETTIVFVKLENSGGISRLVTPPQIKVEPFSHGNEIVLRVSISEKAKIGDKYSIKLAAKANVREGIGITQLGFGYTIGFPVIVADKSEVEITNGVQGKETFGATGSISRAVTVLSIILAIGLLIFLIYKTRIASKKKR